MSGAMPSSKANTAVSVIIDFTVQASTVSSMECYNTHPTKYVYYRLSTFYQQS